MKIARSSTGLQKPRGFHNHWDIGKELKAREEQKLQQHKDIKTKLGHKDIYIVDGKISGLGYTVAKKAKDLWQGEGRMAELRVKKADCLKELNSLSGDMKTIGLLFGDNPDEFSRQQRLNEDKQAKLHQELSLINEQLSALKQDKEVAADQAWQPLYA